MCLPGRRLFSIASNVGKESGSSLVRPEQVHTSFYDSSDEVADAIASKLAQHHLLLLTDYDGTLAEIAPTPDAAILVEPVKQSLRALESLPDTTFGVVSGRRLADVRDRVGAVARVVAGLHGLEIVARGASFRHAALEPARPAIGAIRQEATARLAWCPNLLLEDKTYALTCHVRLTPPHLAERALSEFAAIASPLVEAGALKLLSGAQALEVLPNTDWHKGRAAEWIRELITPRVSRPVTVVYLGDDRTDEDAFDAMAEHDVVIGVGERPHAHLIDFRLAGPASVGRLFAKLAARVL
jgi:trehalose-phosphatase